MRPRTAVELRALFRALLGAALAVGSTACGATVEGDVADAGHDASRGIDTCRPLTTSEVTCANYDIPIAGDPATCSDCLALCGRDIACVVDADAGVVRCRGLTPECPREAGPVDGRRPPLLVNAPGPVTDIGSHFARVAFYEAASIRAFHVLHGELRAHGAPRSILRALQRARRDEVRHARLAVALARSHGAVITLPRIAQQPGPRPLIDIALENAREGCSGELLSALLGLHRAGHAGEPAAREFYRQIADDEIRHAALALRMHDWMTARLHAADRERVERAWSAALRALESAPTDERVGTPSPLVRRQLATRLEAALS